MPTAEAETRRARDTRIFDRIVDITAVALISLAAVLSALCGYQSGRWSGLQSRMYALASATRIEAAEAGTKSVALSAIDVATFLQFINAYEAHDKEKAEFLYRRFRPPMRAATAVWIAAHPRTNPKAPSTPFAVPAYVRASHAAENALATQASADFEAAQAANEHADAFLLLTVTLAGVSFLAGMSTKFVYPYHVVVIGVGCLVFIYCVVRLLELPLR
jgi:hypothetical protein